MKKWIFLMCISVSLPSCSYLTNFYIFNSTEEVITITYKTKKTELYHPFVTAPKIFNFKNLKKVGEKESTNAHIQHKDSLTVIARVHPKKALWIGVERNFSLKYDGHVLEGNLDYFTITQGSATKEYTLTDIATQFEAFTYKVVGMSVE